MVTANIARSLRRDAIARLVLLDWTPQILLILGGLTLSFFLFGFFTPYWRVADQDLLMVYDAFLQNDGQPREIALHPAHLIVMALSTAFRALHNLGLMNAFSLSTLPPASDVAAYEQAWSFAVRVSRLICLAIVLAYVTAFAFLLRRLVSDWRIAVLGTFAIAFSGGIAMSVRSVKPELLSGLLVALALLVLLIAARAPRLAWRPVLVGAAACLATLAMVNKVQAIFLIAALPVLLLPFGETSAPSGFWSRTRARGALLGIFVLAAALLAAAWPLLKEGLDPSSVPLLKLTFQPGLFHSLLALWIALGMAVFARLWRVPAAEAFAAAAAVIGGVALGLLPLYLHHDAVSVVTVMNSIDALLQHSRALIAECGTDGCRSPLMLLLHCVGQMLRHHSFVLHTSPRPEIFVEWAVIAGIVYAWRRGETKLALQAALLIGATLGIDTLQAARALKQDYFNFTDPPIIIAGALLLAKLTDLHTARLAYPLGALLIALHVALSQAEPIKHAYLLKDGPHSNCEFLNNLKRVDRFPFCAP